MTDQFEIQQDPAKDPDDDGSSILAIIALSCIMVILAVAAVALVAEAFDSDKQVLTESVDVTTNAERVEAADINLEDVVENPDAEQLELLIESDFFEENGFNKKNADRLNRQAEKKLKEISERIPRPQLPEANMEDVEERINQAKRLFENVDGPDLEELKALADRLDDISDSDND